MLLVLASGCHAFLGTRTCHPLLPRDKFPRTTTPLQCSEDYLKNRAGGQGAPPPAPPLPALDELINENERLSRRLDKSVKAAYKRTAEAYPQVALSSLASSLSDAFAASAGEDAAPPEGAADLQGPESYPEGPDRAIGIVSELKGSASLFAAFAFGALNLPGALTISESRVTSATSSVSTSRPVPESDLLQAFVVLDAATFAFMLVCVVVCQQLLFRLSDGSYARSPCSTDASPRDPRDSALGVLATQYALEFRTARFAFGLGLVAILLATVVKTWAIFDSSVALPVTEVVGLSSACIGFFYVRNARAFRRLDAPPPGSRTTGLGGGDAFTQAGAAAAVALALWVATLAAGSLSGAPGVTAERGFQNVVASMERAAAEKADSAKAAAEKAVAERAAELRVVEARAAAEQAIGERAAAERVAAEKRAASSMAMGEAEAARIYAQAAANTAKIGGLPGLEGVGVGASTGSDAGAGDGAGSAPSADAAAGRVEAAEKAAAAAAEASASADKALAQKAVTEQVAVERLGAAEKAALKASAARVAADKVAAEKANAERAAGASMRAAADRDEAERLQESLARAQAQAAAAATSAQQAAVEAKAQADSAIEEALSKAQEAKEAPAMIQEAAAAAARKAAADAQVASEAALAAAQAAVEAAKVAPAQVAAEADAALDSAAVDVDVIAELRQRLRL